jgi:hypothetical protein
MAMPMMKEMRAKIKGKLAPTAAKASFPMARPTTILSTTL